MSARDNRDATREKTVAGSGKPAAGPPANADCTARVRSHELLRDGGQLIIEHAGREYRLRVTSKGKLILTA
jgi:hemin uptake protein HemP